MNRKIRTRFHFDPTVAFAAPGAAASHKASPCGESTGRWPSLARRTLRRASRSGGGASFHYALLHAAGLRCPSELLLARRCLAFRLCVGLALLHEGFLSGACKLFLLCSAHACRVRGLGE